MGITKLSLDRLEPHLNLGNSMLELGAQNIYDSEYYGWIAKDYFEAIGIEHVSIDIIQHQGCEFADLRGPLVYTDFDIVTNFGTLEHVDGSLYQPLLNIHNACRPNGLMIHENPRTENWPGHGQHYFTVGFWETLASVCDYEILDLCEEPAMGNTVDGWNVCCALRKTTDEAFISEEVFNRIYSDHIKAK